MSDDASNLAKKYKIPVPKALESKDPILVIEDQTDLRLIVAHQLNKLGFITVKQAANGFEAIEQIKSLGPNVRGFQAYICDMDMPVMGGLDFLHELRENTDLDRGPFALTMDQVSKEKIMLAVETGCDEILVKPFTLGDIGPKVRSAFKKFHIPSNPEKVYELAKTLLREGKFDESEKIYTELSNAAPNAARPEVGIARIYSQRGDMAKALEFLAKAEQKNKNFVHLYSERGKVFASQGKWEDAINSFKQAIDLSPLNAIRYKSAADLLFKVKRYQEAADLLEIAIKHKLEFPDLYHYLSQAKFALKDFKAAAKYVKSALSTDSENVTYLNQLGICLKELDQRDEAGKVYNQIIKLDPANVAALYNKAVLVHAEGDIDEAIKLLDRIIRKQPDFTQAKSKLEEYSKELDSKKAS
jgi:tetratricopeptide (TPR) repeat protein